ncbi:MAG: hypothetical protein GXY86_03095 [Firmicutes bacterium]|nr:hypothetical protein [Bacillota bacterium]
MKNYLIPIYAELEQTELKEGDLIFVYQSFDDVNAEYGSMCRGYVDRSDIVVMLAHILKKFDITSNELLAAVKIRDE